VVTNREVDPVDDNIDIALQVGSLGKSALVARKIAGLTQIVCASPAYLARRGRPVRPSDLAQHSCLTLSHIPASRIWSFVAGGETVRVEVSGSAAADSAHMLLKLAVAGVGIIRFGDIIVAQAIRDGLLMPVLEDWQEPESFPLWALQQAGRQRTPRVKAFVDFLTEHFGQTPWRARPTK
jgi:DNA-binding transcriptional LysR family regulator